MVAVWFIEDDLRNWSWLLVDVCRQVERGLRARNDFSPTIDAWDITLAVNNNSSVTLHTLYRQGNSGKRPIHLFINILWHFLRFQQFFTFQINKHSVELLLKLREGNINNFAPMFSMTTKRQETKNNINSILVYLVKMGFTLCKN